MMLNKNESLPFAAKLTGQAQSLGGGAARRIGTFLLAFLSLATARGDEPFVETIDGQKIAFRTFKLVDDKIEIVSNEPARQRTFSFDSLRQIVFAPHKETATPQPGRSEPIRVQLTDGSIIRGTLVGASRTQLTVHPEQNDEAWQLDVSAVSTMLFRDHALDSPQWNDWLALNQRPPTASDGLAVLRNEQLQWVEGVIGEINGDNVEFSVEQRTAMIKRSRIEGLRFFRTETASVDGAICQAELLGGTRLTVARLKSTGKFVHATLASGVPVEIPTENLLRIGFGVGRTEWLSDLTPTTVDWKPLIGGSAVVDKLRQLNLPKTNESFRGGPLKLEVSDKPGIEFTFSIKSYQRGFAMPGGSRLAFDLDAKYRKLTGLVGFDPEAAPSGNVDLVVRGDQREIVRQNLSNDSRRNPISLDVDISQIVRLVVEVEYRDGRSSGDLLNLCDWQLHK